MCGYPNFRIGSDSKLISETEPTGFKLFEVSDIRVRAKIGFATLALALPRLASSLMIDRRSVIFEDC
jgi:hypothetical protein